MRKDQIRIGGIYGVKVGAKVSAVRIVTEHSSGGWTGVNETTGREVRIKSAAKCRFELVKDGESFRKVDQVVQNEAIPEEVVQKPDRESTEVDQSGDLDHDTGAH